MLFQVTILTITTYIIYSYILHINIDYKILYIKITFKSSQVKLKFN